MGSQGCLTCVHLQTSEFCSHHQGLCRSPTSSLGASICSALLDPQLGLLLLLLRIQVCPPSCASYLKWFWYSILKISTLTWVSIWFSKGRKSVQTIPRYVGFQFQGTQGSPSELLKMWPPPGPLNCISGVKDPRAIWKTRIWCVADWDGLSLSIASTIYPQSFPVLHPIAGCHPQSTQLRLGRTSL